MNNVSLMTIIDTGENLIKEGRRFRFRQRSSLVTVHVQGLNGRIVEFRDTIKVARIFHQVLDLEDSRAVLEAFQNGVFL